MATRQHNNPGGCSAKKSTTVPTGRKGRVRKKADTANVITSDTSTHKAESEINGHVSEVCVNCGGDLLFLDETRLCPRCNSEASIVMIRELASVVMEPAELDRGIIDCPGATIVDPQTGEPIEGAVFGEDESDGYSVKHVKWPVFPPGHKKRRMIPTEAFGKIRRCRACQDYTVRLRRKEGADFCAPSVKFPYRKRLKSVDLVSHRQA